MSSITLKKKRSREFENKQEFTIDALLDMMIFIDKSGETDRCICTYCPNSNMKNVFNEREIVPNINVSLNSEGSFRLIELLNKLKICGYPLNGAMISIYSCVAEEYICFGSDTIDQSVILEARDYLTETGIIKIKCVCNIEDKLICKEKKGFSRVNSCNNINGKRTKERKIGYIIEKVNLWRRYYNGFKDENGQFIKYSLDESAKRIGIAKKSLDDYLLQLRLGRKYGFDFNCFRNSKVGLLRTFVKKHKVKENENNTLLNEIKQDY